jgi:hypothetical protein
MWSKTHSAALWVRHVVLQRRLSRPLPVKGMPCRVVQSLAAQAHEMSQMGRSLSRGFRRYQVNVCSATIRSPGVYPCPIPDIISSRCFFIASCCTGCDQDNLKERIREKNKNKGGRQATPEDERSPCFSTTRYKSSSTGLNSCS